ncbi:MAG: DUF4907 domain-containing protein [Crocinitomicaceae bacterium]
MMKTIMLKQHLLWFKNKGILLCLILFTSCSGNNPETEENESNSIVSEIVPQEQSGQSADTDLLENSEDNFTYETVFIEDQGWGYEIYNNDKLYINQPHIPAIQGVKGFSSSEKAAITAEFAIYKIQNGILPPTLSKQELDSLNVLD